MIFTLITLVCRLIDLVTDKRLCQMEFKWSLLVYLHTITSIRLCDCILQHESTAFRGEEVRISSLHVQIYCIYLFGKFILRILFKHFIYIYFIIIAKELKKLLLLFDKNINFFYIYIYFNLFFSFLSNIILKNIDFFKIIRLLIFKIFLVFIIIARNKSFEGYVWSVLIDSIYL